MTSEQGVRCHVCGGQRCPGTTRYVSTGTAPVIIEGVPALVCKRCHTPVISPEAVDVVQQLIAARPRPTRTITVPVYELAKGRYADVAAGHR